MKFVHFAPLLPIFFLLAAACNQPAASVTDSEIAPNFSFTLYIGQEVIAIENPKLTDLQGKPIVLNFWGALCPPCRTEIPDLQNLYEKYGEKITVLGIDIGQPLNLGTHQEAQDLLKDLGVTYPAGYPTYPDVARTYNLFSIPRTLFLTRDGEIFKRWDGPISKTELDGIVENLLAQN